VDILSEINVTELELAAFHESGHAVATVLAFRRALWLPPSVPKQPIHFVRINENGGGDCRSANVFSIRWGIAPHYRPLMEWQTIIELAGPFAEGIHCGERSRHRALEFAKARCHADADLKKVEAVLECLRSLGVIDTQHLIDRTLVLLLVRWPAVEALAQALIQHRHIEGADVEKIIAAA
jgi:hypothetical protein